MSPPERTPEIQLSQDQLIGALHGRMGAMEERVARLEAQTAEKLRIIDEKLDAIVDKLSMATGSWQAIGAVAGVGKWIWAGAVAAAAYLLGHFHIVLPPPNGSH